MPFPSQEWIAYCLENPWLQEGWEPRFGDWVYLTEESAIALVMQYNEANKTAGKVIVWEPLACQGVIPIEELTFLPCQHQLVEMLEKEGKSWRQGQIDPLYKDAWLKEGLIKPDDDYWASIRPEIGDEKRIICYGPCPEIALGEVVKAVRQKGEK